MVSWRGPAPSATAAFGGDPWARALAGGEAVPSPRGVRHDETCRTRASEGALPPSRLRGTAPLAAPPLTAKHAVPGQLHRSGASRRTGILIHAFDIVRVSHEGDDANHRVTLMRTGIPDIFAGVIPDTCGVYSQVGEDQETMAEQQQIALVPAQKQDEPALWLMLTYAASMAEGGKAQVPAAKRDPYLKCYVEDWGTRPGDMGIIARNGAGECLGAAWVRLGGEGGQFKLGDERVPELATAVVPHARRRGIGRKMMEALIEAARGRYPGMVLSVREDNPAVSFYAALGFHETGRMKNRVGGDSLVMSLDLSRTAEQDKPSGRGIPRR